MLNEGKLITLLRGWPDGAVYTSEWLHSLGYSNSLLQQYHRSGWIKLIGKGAYCRTQLDKAGAPQQNAIPLQWNGGVWALQALRLDHKDGEPPSVLIAARTALELNGYAHFVNLSGVQTVWLFVEPGYRVPTWFVKYPWDAKVRLYAPKLFSKHLPGTISRKDWGPFFTYVSSPERAIMELLELCPQEESLAHAKLVMESLSALRPKVAQKLLENCTSIKVKRLFLALADLCNHPWLKELDTKKLDLGTGPRILVPGEGYHPGYQVSVPREDGQT